MYTFLKTKLPRLFLFENLSKNQGINNTRYDGCVRPPSRMKTHAGLLLLLTSKTDNFTFPTVIYNRGKVLESAQEISKISRCFVLWEP